MKNSKMQVTFNINPALQARCEYWYKALGIPKDDFMEEAIRLYVMASGSLSPKLFDEEQAYVLNKMAKRTQYVCIDCTIKEKKDAKKVRC